MGIAKCRLDIWNPTIGGSATDKWVTAQTPENRNAVISVYVFDKLANPRNAEIVISNRAKNFAAANDDTFTYNYYDSDGTALPSSGTYTLQKNQGVLTNFFQDFQSIRLVDQASNQVFFAGRILSIKEGYDARKGQLLTLRAIDSLYELSKMSLRGMSKSIQFYKGSNGQTVTDMVKAYLSMFYKKEKLMLYVFDHITKDSGTDIDDLIADTIYYPTSTTTQYKTNIVTDDTGTALRNRFVTSAVKISSDRKIDLTKLKKQGFLGEILKALQHNPKANQSSNEFFGWDYFVDPNISYGEHVDFQGKNLDPATPPPPQMFNAFERGKRVYETNPAEYGLAVKYPAASSVVTQGHRITVPASGSSVLQYATKPMSIDFDFTRPKENLYSSVLLKYNNAESDTKGTTQKDSGVGKEQELAFDIMYVTEINGKFKYESVSGSGNTEEVDAYAFLDSLHGGDSLTRPGVFSAEWCTLYQSNGTTVVKEKACRIQYQSSISLSGSTNYGYVLVTHLTNDFLNQTAGNYVLKGRGDGSGTNASNATCKINLGATIANQGYPRRVWGIEKQKILSEGALVDGTAMRQEIASTLSRSSVNIVDGVFSMSGPPMYYWDGEVRTIANVTGGQAITVQNVGVHANGDTPGTAVELWRYGFREGMAIAKMNAGYTALTQVNGRDVYGYCFNTLTDTSVYVNLTEAQDFAAGDKVRFFIPLRAGDTIRVENIVTDIAGNHLITELTYTEEPNQMTRLKTTGVNEGFGLGTIGFQASLTSLREESDITMNIPKGHQVAVWNGLFSAIDNNTVQWQTVGGKAEVLLADGTIYDVDTATTNNNHTTDAAGTDSSANRFGLATAPAAGDDTVYYIYLDPNTENVQKDTDGTHYKHHFYTRPSGTPATGSDPAYEQDGDNIIIGWVKAGATSDDNAEFGVYRDSKPGEGKRNAATVIHSSSLTSALLKKGARPWTSNLSIRGTAYNAIVWDNGTANTDATLNFSDGTDTITILDGAKTSGLADNTTNYMYLNGITGSITPSFTTVHGTAIGDSKILLALVVVGDSTKGLSPTILPFNSKIPTLNAVAIAADAIVADAIASNTIDVDHLRIGPSGGAIAGFTTAGTLNLNFIGSGDIDNIGDGSTYGRLRVNNLNSGNIDLANGNYLNKNLDNIANTSNYARTSPTQVGFADRAGAGLSSNNRVSQNIVASASASGVNITAYFFGGSDDSPDSLLLINAAGLASYTGVTGDYPNFSLPSTATFQILTSNGQAQFGANTIIADSDGLKVYDQASSGSLIAWIKPTTGISTEGTANSGYFFQKLADGASGTRYGWITSGTSTSTTYGNNTAGFDIFSIYEDIVINASAQDIGLFPDSDAGYVKIADRPLVFMDKTDPNPGNSLHSDDMDFVGFWKRSGDIGASVVYRLPFTGAGDGKVLAIDGYVVGGTTGAPTNPYIWDLEWVDGGGGVTDHGALTGLADTDHSAYALVSHGSHTDTNTTYSAGFALDLSGTTFALDLTELTETSTSANADLFVVLSDGGSHFKIEPEDIEISRFKHSDNTYAAYGSGGGSGTVHAGGNATEHWFAFYNGNNITEVDDAINKLSVEVSSGKVKFHASTIYGNQRIEGVYTGSLANPSITIYNDSNTGLMSGSSDQVRLIAGGVIGVDVNENSGAARIGINGGYSAAYSLHVSGGAAKTVGGTTWVVPSDDRIKTDVASITDGLTTIAALNPISYKWTDEYKEATHNNELHTLHGYLASEFRNVFPDYVIDGPAGLVQIDGQWFHTENPIVEHSIKNLVSINASAIVPHLVAAIKELKARIEALEGE